MSIYADPGFVKAEVDYRRETMLPGHATSAGTQHHAAAVRAALRNLRVAGRHTGRSHRGRHTPRPA